MDTTTIESQGINWVGWLGVVLAMVAIALPILRDRAREKALDKVIVGVERVPQFAPFQTHAGYQPIRAAIGASTALVLHVANLAKSPVFIRDVRLILRDRHASRNRNREIVHKEGSPERGIGAMFSFTPFPETTDALDVRQSRYYYLPVDRELVRAACGLGAGPSLLEDVEPFVEVRDHGGVIWSGLTDIGSDIGEGSIDMVSRERQAAAASASSSPAAPIVPLQ